MIGLIIGIIFGSLIILFWLVVLFIEINFRHSYNKRGDGTPCMDYPLFSEFPSLLRRPISFYSKKNLLRGYVYKHKDVKEYKAVIVLVHGIGFGHWYLLEMIENLAKNGYIVMAYDQSASGISEGRRVKCLNQAVIDIDKALSFKENDEELKQYKTYLFGHSWGGYAVLSALSLNHKLDKVISVSGFNSEPDMVGEFTKWFRPFKGFIYVRNFLHYGKYAFITGYKGLMGTNSKVLYLQGKCDLVVPPSIGGNMFSKVTNPNVTVKMLDGKAHTPFVLQKSQEEQDKAIANLGILGGVMTPYNFTIDFRKISEKDSEIYQLIVDFYNN